MNPLQCCVCSDPETQSNRVLNCKKCGISVHMLCYGIENYTNKWKCSPCRLRIKEPMCSLCEQKNGALKKTVCGNWAHVICALFTEGVRFMDVNKVEPIDIGNLSDAKRKAACHFCGLDTGFCPLCSKSSCKYRLHITCAQINGCLIEETKRDDKIAFRAYCLDHKPKNSSRRISSQFVRGQVLKANGRKKHQKLSSQLNSDWITKRSKRNLFEKEHVISKNNSENDKHVRDVATNQEWEASLDALFTPDQVNNNVNSTIAVAEITQEHVKSSLVPFRDMENRSTGRSLLDELDSVSMWWDTRDLRAENQIEDLLNGNNNENSNTESHICCEGEISKVS